MKEFDEAEAIKYMRAAMPVEAADAYDDDQLLNVIDMIWDYYEQNGLLDIEFDDGDDDPDTLVSDIEEYALRMLKKDKGATIDPQHLPALISAEIEYEESLTDDIMP